MKGKNSDNPPLELIDVATLAPPARAALQAAVKALRAGDLARAERELTIALVHAPRHAEPHRLLGVTLQRRGRPQHAAESFRAALAARPLDPRILRGLALAEADAGDLPAALAHAERLCETQPDAPAFALLAELCERFGEIERALAACERALALDARDIATQLRRGRCLWQTGSIDEAARQFRSVLARKAEPAAWHGLCELRRVKFDAADRAELERQAAQPHWRDTERAVLRHVLARACEDLGDHAAAFAAYRDAAALEHRRQPWDAAAFERHVAGVRDAFAAPLALDDDTYGHDVVFVVGMPRSGSTLIEQVLAAHPQLEGASELPDLRVVIAQESERRQAPLTAWAPRATAADWRRIGEEYLARTQRWRARKPRFSDKMPGNWVYAEAALAALPGARIVFPQRDALETCWSCFKQFFAPGQVSWSRTFEDLARYWHLCQAHAAHLAARYPTRVRLQSYEALLADPEGEIAALLAFCDLPFDAACLRPHEATRTVRSASAAQVRSPLAAPVQSSAPYAAWLEPLREALAVRT